MRRLSWVLVLLVALASAYLLAPRVVAVVHGAPPSTVTPTGDYGVAGFQIGTSPGPTAPETFYCVFTGMANFSGGSKDPVGTIGTLTISAAVTRCNGVIVPPDPQTFSTSYEITGANEFEFFEPGNEARGPLHGRTLNRGDVLLIDGTKRTPIPTGGTGNLVDYATFVRQ